MDYPVPPVTGYRPLSEEDVALMNEVKAASKALLTVHDKIVQRIVDRSHQLWAEEQNAETLLRAAEAEGDEEAIAKATANLEVVKTAVFNWQKTEPLRWASIGRSDIQQGVMALNRAIARPDGDC
ncbi:hypothetical protein PN823_004446 [Enterobacter hormaechei]|nr:hypothetical protein [Enterobacter hormaechei]